MLEDLGIPVESRHHEVAASQHEIDLRHTDALTMADTVMTYRLVVKEIAMNHGCYATFMPKPVYGVNGSGMHVHSPYLKVTEMHSMTQAIRINFRISPGISWRVF